MRSVSALVTTVLAGTLVFATPAHAHVTFDFATNTGFVDAEDLRRGFDWDAATLLANAARLEFQHTKQVEDAYSVTCGPAGSRPFEAVHVKQGAREFLIATPARGPAKDEILGFRITGASAAISSTTLEPTPGTPCPEKKRGRTVRTSRVVSTTTTRTLIADHDTRNTALLQIRTGPDNTD